MRFKNILTFLCLTGFLLGAQPMLSGQNFFGQADAFFQQYVHPPYVDYQAIQKQPEALEGLIKIIATYDLKGTTAAQQKAFWINAYNLLVIQAVVDHYPVQSPRDIPGFFDKRMYFAAGEKMTLNQLEEKKLLLPFADPRIHFALVCAARSCPPLPAEAIRPERVEEQLDRLTRQSVNDPEFLRIGKGRIEISQLFRWYAADFGSVKDFLNQYRDMPLEQGCAIRYYEYDWTLNEASTETHFPAPYRASYLLQRGEVEVKLFNSVYTQQDYDGFERLNSRSTYFSRFRTGLVRFAKKLELWF